MRALMLVLIVPLAACSVDSDASRPGVAGSGSGTTRTFAVADFTALSLRGSDDVDVRVGTGFSVRAEGPSKELDKLKIERVGDTLRIGRKNRNGFSWGSSDDVKVFVTMPRIAAATIAGSGDMAIDRVEGERFVGDTAGSGGLNIAMLGVREAKLSMAGSGNMTLKGSAERLTIDIAGSGDIDASGVKATAAAVAVMGSGGVRADVTGTATVSVMGSGDVDLGKGAKCSISKMGSGEVTCGG
jgi:hypothetical protein